MAKLIRSLSILFFFGVCATTRSSNEIEKELKELTNSCERQFKDQQSQHSVFVKNKSPNDEKNFQKEFGSVIIAPIENHPPEYYRFMENCLEPRKSNLQKELSNADNMRIYRQDHQPGCDF